MPISNPLAAGIAGAGGAILKSPKLSKAYGPKVKFGFARGSFFSSSGS
jgi:hypothetical protein